eukprot:gene12075-8627_t
MGCDLAVPALFAPHDAAVRSHRRRRRCAGQRHRGPPPSAARRSLRADGAALFAADGAALASPAVCSPFAGCRSSASAQRNALLLDAAQQQRRLRLARHPARPRRCPLRRS